MASADVSHASRAGEFRLLLLVAGDAPRSRRARRNLADTLASANLPNVEVEEVDVLSEPRQALRLGVFATPALVWTDGETTLGVLYGELSDRNKILDFLKS